MHKFNIMLDGMVYCTFKNSVFIKETKKEKSVLSEEFAFFDPGTGEIYEVADLLNIKAASQNAISEHEGVDIHISKQYHDRYKSGWFMPTKHDITFETYNLNYKVGEYIPVRIISNGKFRSNDTDIVNLIEVDTRFLDTGIVEALVEKYKDSLEKNKIVITKIPNINFEEPVVTKMGEEK